MNLSRRRTYLATTLALIGVLSAGGTNAFAAEPVSCEGLKTLSLNHVTITSVEEVSAGRSFSFAATFIGLPFVKTPASCRVKGTIAPTDDSDIRFELWMPQSEWNGKFQGIGNGGLAGAIDKLSLRNALSRGYAAVATDTGHEASDLDGRWALGHPEKIIDFGYRAIHETTVAGKAIATAFYGRTPEFSYFGSCSNGGREGLMEAQRYPDDYDGILAGAPAFDGVNNIGSVSWMQQILLKGDASYIPSYKLPAISTASLAACDANDGVKDGVIDDPRTCNFKPEDMLCKGGDNMSCLTSAQVASLHAVYDGPPGGLGDSTNHGYERGGEAGWSAWVSGPSPRKSIAYRFSHEFHRYLILNDPEWTLDKFDYAVDRKRDEEIFGHTYNARDPDLTQFFDRGGKLMLYHGWNDPALQPRITIDYYNRVQAKMGAAKTEQSVRLYMVPGMEHCFGGPGANTFGQLPAGGTGEPSHDIDKALEVWVETGKAPDAIIATKYDESFRPLFAPEKATALRTRPLCPYPQVARWSGEGSTDDAANFACVTP